MRAVLPVLATQYKKTKIIATLGPASEGKIEELLLAGVNGIRLNFSHGTHAWHGAMIKKVRAAARKLSRSVAIIQDLQGPKILIASLPEPMQVEKGQKLTMQYGADYTQAGIIPIQYDFSRSVAVGQRLYIRDGAVICEITRVHGRKVEMVVRQGGKFSSNHGINLPDTYIAGSKLVEKDIEDIRFGLTQDIDYIAQSFVQTAEDIAPLREMIKRKGKNIKIITKIETAAAAEHLHEIIAASDAVMIARGDLAVETSAEAVPIIGRQIIQIARTMRTPVIMATQMLEGMTSSMSPTRAEANDVSTAVTLGVDAVMLSGESAIGAYPIETVAQMKRIILITEKYMFESGTFGTVQDFTAGHSSGDAVSRAAQILAESVGAKLILAETASGHTARSIAALRPSAAIIMASPDLQVCNQLAIVWGSKPYKVLKGRYVSAGIMRTLLKIGALKKGDFVVCIFGTHAGKSGATDTVRLLVA
jgi:pyruvate kinase